MIKVVTGGSGSGKSEYAEGLAMTAGCKKKVYIATMMVWDEEGRSRVEKHRRQRAGKGFETLELPVRLGTAAERMDLTDSAVLLEDLSNLVMNEFYGERPEDTLVQVITDEILQLSIDCRELILVTNEIFSDGLTYSDEVERYLRILAEVNRNVSKMAEEVYEVVAGIPLKVK